jgi:hypothetical protein
VRRADRSDHHDVDVDLEHHVDGSGDHIHDEYDVDDYDVDDHDHVDDDIIHDEYDHHDDPGDDDDTRAAVLGRGAGGSRRVPHLRPDARRSGSLLGAQRRRSTG